MSRSDSNLGCLGILIVEALIGAGLYGLSTLFRSLAMPLTEFLQWGWAAIFTSADTGLFLMVLLCFGAYEILCAPLWFLSLVKASSRCVRDGRIALALTVSFSVLDAIVMLIMGAALIPFALPRPDAPASLASGLQPAAFISNPAEDPMGYAGVATIAAIACMSMPCILLAVSPIWRRKQGSSHSGAVGKTVIICLFVHVPAFYALWLAYDNNALSGFVFAAFVLARTLGRTVRILCFSRVAE